MFNQRKNPDVDVIQNILKAILEVQPDSAFVQSLLKQYVERGGLSKKQLEGLFSKAQKFQHIPVNWLATLEAEILKKPTRYKSTLPANTPLYKKEESTGKMIDEILAAFPQHKRVLFFKSKYENNVPLSSIEITELGKFHKMVTNKK